MTAATASTSTPPFIEQLPENWATAEVIFLGRDNEQVRRYQILDMRSEPYMQYRYESTWLTSFKCVEIAIATPLYLLGNLLFRVLRTVCLVSHTIFRSTVDLLADLSLKNLGKWVESVTYEAPAALIQGVVGCVTAPFYALWMVMGALYGIVRPLEGRVIVSTAERAWSGSSRSYDISRFQGREVEFFNELVTDRHSKNTHFLAYCFQPVGPVDKVQSYTILNPS